MLVLSRKLQEQIRIDDRITVTILRTRGNTVRVGIEAPREVRVTRGELQPLPEGTCPRREKCPAARDPKRHAQRWNMASMQRRARTTSDAASPPLAAHCAKGSRVTPEDVADATC